MGENLPSNMPSETSVQLFAYGSNLHTGRMLARVPSAQPIAIGHVIQRRIAFHKRSIDGSAKADAFHTADPDDRVWGVVYRIRAEDVPVLDQYEFLGVGYDRELVRVVMEHEMTATAWMYVARSGAIDPSLKPYAWYLEFVVRGAYQHRLPLCYIRNLHCIASKNDPDTARGEANRRIVFS